MKRQLVCNWCPCRLAADQPVQTVRVTIQLKGLLRIAQKVSQLCDVRMDSIMISALLC